MEISDKSTNPRCQSQVWQHFGFKVTYKDIGLRFKSLSIKVICQTSFHRKQETNKSNEVCNCNRMLLFAPTYDMTMQVSQKIH